jgi:hypothetical protein
VTSSASAIGHARNRKPIRLNMKLDRPVAVVAVARAGPHIEAAVPLRECFRTVVPHVSLSPLAAHGMEGR